MSTLTREVLEKFINEKIAPSLVAHGGFASITSLENNILTIRLGGACTGCHSQMYTSQAVSEYILDNFPELDDVSVLD